MQSMSPSASRSMHDGEAPLPTLTPSNGLNPDPALSVKRGEVKLPVLRKNVRLPALLPMMQSMSPSASRSMHDGEAPLPTLTPSNGLNPDPTLSVKRGEVKLPVLRKNFRLPALLPMMQSMS